MYYYTIAIHVVVTLKKEGTCSAQEPNSILVLLLVLLEGPSTLREPSSFSGLGSFSVMSGYIHIFTFSSPYWVTAWLHWLFETF